LHAVKKNKLCGIAKYDVGFVTVCFTERTEVFSGVVWPDMDGRGRYKLVSKPQLSTLSLDRPSKLSEANFAN
jgi:hypothetical protein